MTEKVFWQDPYQVSLAAEVASVAGDEVTLDRTIFYALSGGQESDRGTIGGKAVLEARKTGREIVYRLESGHGLEAGQAVQVEIDWQRRYRLMRLHQAAEIVLESVYRQFPATEKVGAHIAEDKARIDFSWEGNISGLFPGLQATLDDLVAADKEIVSAFSDETAERRYWTIEGFAKVPCGGTHLKRTGEIGAVTLKRKNPGKGKERIEIYLDEDGGR